MDTLWPPLLLMLGTIATVTSSPYYTVIGPKVVRPNSEYHVSIGTTEISQPSTIYIELSGNLDSGNVFNVSQTITVEPYSTRIVRLEVGDTTPGNYKLVSRGLAGIIFSNSTDLRYIHKSYSVFVQTDRAVYKPGSKVLFRAVILDSRLRPPLSSAQLDIYITDGQGNRIKQWKRRTDSKGVFVGELQLSESPVLGNWKIFINILDQTFEKQFEVAEYVLPKFEVVIDVPKHATFKDSSVTATVRARYTYGKPVKGEATITAYPDIFSDVIQPIFQAPVRKVVPIDGNVTVNFDIGNELRLTDDYKRPIQLEVAVKEALTGRIQNTSAQMILHKHQYTMELIQTAKSYKPGLKYTAFIKIAHHDGAPVQDQINPVQIWYGFSHDQSAYTNITRMLDKHGMIQLDFYPPLAENDTSAALNIQAQYLTLHESFSTINQALSPSGTYIQALLKTEKPMVNSNIEIEVNSTAPLKYLSYQVLGRGDILNAASVKVPEEYTVKFRFLATYVMAPTAHILVYYMRDDGEIVADSLNVDLDGALQNFVDIKTMLNETTPGANVDLVISSKPNSYIALLGVDQSSILLKSGNDISHDQILNELKSYDMNNEFSSVFPAWGSSSWSPGSSTAFDVFNESGAVVLTNGYVHDMSPLSQPGIVGGRIDGFHPGVSTLRPDIGPPVTYRIATRPPLAGPYAFSRIPTPVWNKPHVFPMHDISNTWLFANFSSGPEGKTVLRRSVPDTITSWVLTAFSIDSVHGLGLIDTPRKLKVFQPFFVSLDLPYSVIRGEIVAIPIVVFNYLDKDLTAEVVLENMNQFEFAEISNEIHDTPKLELYRRKTIDIKANSQASVSFMIIPRDLGHIVIKATARSTLAGDGIEQKLLVKSEGETQYRNKAIFVDLRNAKTFETNLTVDIPRNAVVGSEHVEISAVGDILGPSIPNLANLIKMPFGCGEQNMLNFVPNIVVINYLKNTDQLTQAVKAKALKYMEIGYQQELTYRHEDGSFSAFGTSDHSGSTWLTAFVAKSFAQAAEHIMIEDRIIKEALQWLTTNQSPNGSFPEVGKVSHRDMQGGAAKGLALTAFTLVAFLENRDYFEEYSNVVNKGVDYIVRNLEGLDDVYSLCLCTYVLNLAKNPYEDTAFNRLESKAKQSGDYMWWSKPIPEDNKNPWYSLPSSVDVEMTSYALLTYLRRNMVADSLPIMKWLVSQRNADGGFASTQDTVIGIYALSKLSEKISSKNSNIAISFVYEDGGQSNININPGNNMILQKHMLPRKTREVNLTATGTGFAIIQVSYSYNLNVTGAWPLFTLDPQVDKNSNANHLQLSICSGFVPTKEANESNMAVMEVSLPSGFTVDIDSLPSLEISQHVKRIETKNGETMVVLYFDKMIREEYCPTVSAFRTHKVAKQKPVPVSIYDYYDSSRRARVFYEPQKATLCDICDGEDCGNVCVGVLDNQKNENDGSRGSACTMYHLSSPALLFVIMFAKSSFYFF
ncbi:CD109 antigen isoform X3 [Neodiprion pinetum]|nr:CD109 antigen-like isoform X3 [Neodiprion pinetum]XP_046483768.1 CD109 antigen-like isoform X3 [Neodiprion pinetum]